MKILERADTSGFGQPAQHRERVVEVPDGQPLPAGAQRVPDATPLQDWAPIGSAFIAPEPEPAPATAPASVKPAEKE